MVTPNGYTPFRVPGRSRMSFDPLLLSERKKQIAELSSLSPERLATSETIVSYLFGKDDESLNVMSKRLYFMLRSNSEISCAFAEFILTNHDQDDFEDCIRTLKSRVMWFVKATDSDAGDNRCLDTQFNYNTLLVLHNTVAAVLSDCFFRNLHHDVMMSHIHALSQFCRAMLLITQPLHKETAPRKALLVVLTTLPYGYCMNQLLKDPPPAPLLFLLMSLKAEVVEQGRIDLHKLLPDDAAVATRTPSPFAGPVRVDATPPKIDDERVIRVTPKRRRLGSAYDASESETPDSVLFCAASPRHAVLF